MNDGATSRARKQPGKCRAWPGPPEWYQAEARQELEVTVHHWIIPTCSTPMCLRAEHVIAEIPAPLDYPDGICVYCGLSADTVDHLLPRSWTGDTPRRRVLTVPACRECNSMIGDRYAPSIDERREIAHAAIAKKYRRYLAVAEDIEDIVAGLGPNLRSAITKQIAFGDLIRDRLAWPGLPGYDLGPIQRAGVDDPYAAGLLAGVEVVEYVGEDYTPTRFRVAEEIEVGSRVPTQRAEPPDDCGPDCRCRWCKKLTPRDRHHRERVLIDGRLVHPNPKRGHGLYATHQAYGCRCEPCCEAAKARSEAVNAPRRWRAAERLAVRGGAWRLVASASARTEHFLLAGTAETLCGKTVGDHAEAAGDVRCKTCEARLDFLGRVPVDVWIPAPRRPSQGMLDLWFNGRGVPDSHSVKRRRAA